MLEYIPGDFVIIETESAKPRVVKVSTVDEDSVIYCEGWGEVRFYDKIKPIPLTSEILEKNGWDFTGYNMDFNGYLLNICSKCGILPYIYYYYTTGDFSVSICGEVILPNMKYIHQLQHLLFGLGLSSEMEV